jgi:thymidylate kinase
MGGQHCAFLGIDSIGKTTVSKIIAERMHFKGQRARLVTWKSTMRGSEDPFVRATLETLYVQTYAMMFAGAAQRKKGRVEALLSTPAASFLSSGAEKELASLEVDSNTPPGLLAMSLIELAGNLFIHSKEIALHRQAGEFVIQDSYGFKHVVKELILMRESFTDKGAGEAVFAQLLELVSEIFSRFMAPDVGVFLRAEPALAMKYGGGRQWGLVEDMRSVGQPGADGFLRLQNECNQLFEAFAQANDWLIIDITEEPIEWVADKLEAALFRRLS